MKNLTIITAVFYFLFLSVTGIANTTDSKQNIKVLYVGFNPEKPKPEKFGNEFGGAPERINEDYQTRWPAFKAYLEERFKNVKCVDPREYKEEMSAKADVTIFDEMITPIKDVVREYDENEQLIKYEPAQYLSSGYDHATIFIGKVGPGLGNTLGSKLDWHCYCLNGDAQNINTDHAIFNTPLKVNPTMVMQNTPEYFLHENPNLPKQLPMWVVQTHSRKNSNYMLGMVSRSGGFLDSPDTEYISGAECKSVNSVALGRHGNLFLWGFSGSPDYMTEEGKMAFFNTIVYMNKFKGAELIAKKMDQTIIIRDPYLDYRKNKLTVENFESYKTQWMKYNEKTFKRIEEIKALKASGQKLSRIQEALLSKEKPVPTLQSWVKDNISEEAFAATNGDIEAYKKYVDKNREYFFCVKENWLHHLELDKDLKSLNVSNREIYMLEKCVEMLRKGEQTQIAQRLLIKYTEEDFATAKEWDKWLTKNHEKLFFTEAGGYKWLVNTLK